MTDGGYRVYLRNGDTHHYDNVTVVDGWLKCYLHRPHRNNKMIAFPPDRVEKFENSEVVA